MRDRFVALVLVSFASAWILKAGDSVALKKIDSMSAFEYIEHLRHIHGHSYIIHYFSALLVGGLFILAVELLAYAFHRLNRKTTAPNA